MKNLIWSAILTLLLFGLVSCGPDSGSAITVYYEEYAQVELISSKGTRVLIDVNDPSKLSGPATQNDFLLTTHTHFDHINSVFISNFKGQQLFCKTGQIRTADVAIQGLAAAHNEGDPFLSENGTNYIFIVDMDGLRIAHFGDIGQESLTTEQLTQLGKVDLAVMQFDNSYSQMNTENQKGFNLMAQLKPRLIIPTHNSMSAAEIEMKLWPCLYSKKPAVKIRRGNLTKKTRILFMGATAPGYARITKATAVRW